jgi:XisH protein
MPSKDAIHLLIKQALIKDGWEITDDPYVISYGERFLFIDLGAVSDALGDGVREASQREAFRRNRTGQFIGARREGQQIAVEIKSFRGRSAIADLEQAIGQYSLYRLLLRQIDEARELYLAVTSTTFEEIFSEPIGELVIRELSIKLIIVDVKTIEVVQWIA